MLALLLSHPLALAALVLGYALLVVEMCVPGFGVPGVLGIALSIAGLFLMEATPLQLLVLIAVFVVLLLIALAICLCSISKGRLAKSKLVLRATSTRTTDHAAAENPRDYAGRTGAALTPLRPAGIAEIDGARLNVVTEGGYIDAGAPVRVLRVDGNRILVTQIKEDR